MTATLPLDRRSDPRPVPKARRGWWIAGLIVAFLFVGWGVWNLVGTLSHESIHLARTWTGTVRTVDIRTDQGSITLVGTDRQGATVTGHGARGLSTPTDTESLKGGALSIDASCPFVLGNNWCSMSYTVTVPAGTSVVAHSGDGAVHVTAVSGSLDLSSGDGSVTADRPSGPLNLHSSDGSVHVTGATSRTVTAHSGDGSVHLGFAQPPETVDASSSDGSVTIGLPRSTLSYQVKAGSSDGHVSTAIRTDPASSHVITAHSGDGSVTLRYGSG